jgi:probable HAF family extracellular repeat protein
MTQVRGVTAINDFGQIIGMATINGQTRAIRLDPVTPK